MAYTRDLSQPWARWCLSAIFILTLSKWAEALDISYCSPDIDGGSNYCTGPCFLLLGHPLTVSQSKTSTCQTAIARTIAKDPTSSQSSRETSVIVQTTPQPTRHPTRIAALIVQDFRPNSAAIRTKVFGPTLIWARLLLELPVEILSLPHLPPHRRPQL